MRQLWTPWRSAYVSSSTGPTGGCIFCLALEGSGDAESLVVHLGARAFILMNLFPYNSGHVLVAPRDHVANLGDLAPPLLADLMTEVQLAERVLRRKYKPAGFNIGMNLGRDAGAGVPDHLHMHVVPRWQGDTNFMTVLGEARVISEEVLRAARELREIFAEKGV